MVYKTAKNICGSQDLVSKNVCKNGFRLQSDICYVILLL